MFFATDVLYNWISQFKISYTNVWRRNPFWEIVSWPLTLWPSATQDGYVDQVWRRLVKVFSSYWNGLDKFDHRDLDLWPSDPKINRVPLLHRKDVWTRYEKGRLRRYWSETVWAHLTPVTLTFSSVTPKSNASTNFPITS